jgi:hypothetical protein
MAGTATTKATATAPEAIAATTTKAVVKAEEKQQGQDEIAREE